MSALSLASLPWPGSIDSAPACAYVAGIPALIQPVNPDYFIADSLVEPIKKEIRTLSDGSKAECYVITTKSVPADHPIGPWAPKQVTDGEDKCGIWTKDGHVYVIPVNPLQSACPSE